MGGGVKGVGQRPEMSITGPRSKQSCYHNTAEVSNRSVCITENNLRSEMKGMHE